MRRGTDWTTRAVTGLLVLTGAVTVAAAPVWPGPGEPDTPTTLAPEVTPLTEVSPARSSEPRPETTPADASHADEPAPASTSEVGSPAVVVETQVGSASYYANSLAGRRTASGVRYDPSAPFAAHRTLPFGTRLRVHNLANGRVVEVEVVDRGPFTRGRILDLSRSAARDLDFIRQGHTKVRIEVLE